MSIIGFINGYRRQFLAARQRRRLLRQAAPASLNQRTWERSLRDPTAFYLDCFRYFHQRLPAELRAHRDYFSKERRGFGEDAMHVMWLLLFETFKPESFLEIGVYRGQTTSLAALLARRQGRLCEVWGISPFSSVGDSVSEYPTGVDYQQDTLANFGRFDLPQPRLFKAFSTDPEAIALINSRRWDMVYIDGNHDYEIVQRDWESCSRSVMPGGIIVLDDAGLTTEYRPPLFATGGHPGPSRLAQEIDRAQFRELLQVGHNRVFQKIS